MTRFRPVTVLMVLLVQVVAGGAQADDVGTLPSGAKVVFEMREIVDPSKAKTDKPFKIPQAATTELFHYFNLAHCNCARANAGPNKTISDHTGNFAYQVHETAPSGSTLNPGIDFWVGTGCTTMDVAQRDLSCMKLDSTTSSVTTSLANVDGAPPYGDFREFNLYEVVNGFLNKSVSCVKDNNVTAAIYAFMRASGATAVGDYDYKASISAGTLSTDTGTTASGVDTQPPPQVASLVANGGDGEIDLSWKPSSSGTTDIAYYQALCQTLDNRPVHSSRTDDPQYVTTAATCPGFAIAMGDADAETPVPTALDNGDQPFALKPGAFASLDASFICGTATGGTATSLTLGGLVNDTPYNVIFLTIDLHGNFSATYFDHAITPAPVTDFWELLHDPNNSHAEGGLCLLAETYGNDSALTGALRAFRDDTLGSSRIGRWLTTAYYATLGRLGAVVHGSLALRIVAAIVLAPAVALALLWHWLTLPGLLVLLAAVWLRRWRRAVTRSARAWSWLRVPVMAAGALVVLGTGRAHAGGGYQPYWENGELDDKAKEDIPPGDPRLVDWHVGLRLGPYIPDVDGQVAAKPGVPGPYAQMFGGYHMLTMLDVDYILWKGFGQLGVGGSIGYWQKTARPFTDNAHLDSPNPERQPGNKNAFKLVPLELSATYRLTMLDDNYGVPIVPYVRGGLAYYIWWITAPNGHYARVCSDGGMEPSCAQNKALGASIGLQGAIGLSIRGERIDASAAMSMQNSGIQHAGIYAELSLAKVDGFGSDTKLSVGDTTWFAGVDFEF